MNGIYSFNVLGQTYGPSNAYVYFLVNDVDKIGTYRTDGHKSAVYDLLAFSTQLKLNKGDRAWIRFVGTFYVPSNPIHAYFEGHLTRQINE